MTEETENDKKQASPGLYIRKGFWISLGAAAGIGITALSAGILFVLVFYRIEITSRINQSWKELWYSKEQKEFKKCFEKEFPKYMNASFPGLNKELPKTPTQICKERGYKPFPPFDEQTKNYE